MRRLLFALLVVLGFQAPAFAEVTSLEGAVLGRHVSGPQRKAEDLKGHVVLFESWGMKWCFAPGYMPGKWLQAMHEKFKDQGLIVIGAHCQQEVPFEQVQSFVKTHNPPYTVLHATHLQGDDTTDLPRAWLFDMDGKLVAAATKPDDRFAQKIDALLKASPHWITKGRKIESGAKPVAEGLKTGKTFGWALAELDKLAEKGDAKTQEDVSFLKGEILKAGELSLIEAQAAEGEAACEAERLYAEIALQYKKSELEERATARLGELKKDKAFQEEVKASKLAAEIVKLCASLTSKEGKYDLGSPENKAIAQQVHATLKQLTTKHKDSKAAKRVQETIKAFGFTAA